MKARVGAWTFRIVEVARPGLGSLSFGLSLSLSRTLSIAYRRHGCVSAWRMAVRPYRVRGEARARELPGVRRSRLASSRSPWRWRGGECFNAGVAGSSGAERRRSASGSRHGRTGSGSAVGASGSGWSAPPRVTCCTATYSRRARCHGLNRLGVFRIYIPIYTYTAISYGAAAMSHPSNARLRSAVYTTIYTLYTAQRHPS